VDIHQSRLLICPRTAGPFGPFRGSEAIWRIVDDSMQILGGLGITDDTIVARLFREVRPFHIYDGPSEVRRCSIARRVSRASGTPF
jgi:alkylation response protein AidB-like acyl-CoA dehydrogenase